MISISIEDLREAWELGSMKKNKFQEHLHHDKLFKGETMLASRITSAEGQQHEVETEQKIPKI